MTKTYWTATQITSKYSQAIEVCHNFRIPVSTGMPRKILYRLMEETLDYRWLYSNGQREWIYDDFPF